VTLIILCGRKTADIPFGQKMENQRKDTSPLCETTCPGSLHTRLRGAPKGPVIL